MAAHTHRHKQHKQDVTGQGYAITAVSVQVF